MPNERENYMGEKMIHRIEDIEQMALETGFLPFFYCGIDGLSIEEHTPRELWFSDEQDGPWEWKGPLIGMGSLAYGKLYNGKAGFVSLEWLPDLLNYRRSCYRFPYNDAESEVFDTVVSHQTMLTKDIKRECGFVRPRAPKLSPMEREALRDTPRSLWPKGGEARNRGFETIITRLLRPRGETLWMGRGAIHNARTDVWRRDVHYRPFARGIIAKNPQPSKEKTSLCCRVADREDYCWVGFYAIIN